MLEQLSQIVEEKKCSLFEALMMFIDEQDLEPSEVVKELPLAIVEQLRADAINDNKLRPSTIAMFRQTFSVDDFFH